MRHRTMWAGIAGMIVASASVLAGQISIVVPDKASDMEKLAAREVRRYLYVRTGELVPIVDTTAAKTIKGDRIVLGRNIFDMARSDVPRPQHYRIRTFVRDGFKQLVISGDDDLGTLYAAYRFAEILGVRFFMEGDVVPDERIPLAMPEVSEMGQPLFKLRGIQPFHDFPEGPDWWDTDAYLAIISQLPKMRMNFIGFHTYPQGDVGPEPLTWIGTPEEVGEDGRVKASYPSRHFSTAGGTWGSSPKKTSDYSFGAAMLFDDDDFCQDVQKGMTPWPATPERCNELFNRFGVKLKVAFEHAKRLGVKTCIGTEVPLIVPTTVQKRLRPETSASQASGGTMKPSSEEISRLYEGMFTRIMRTHQLDYYWFWTPEGWTWTPVTEAQIRTTMDDFKMAIAAAAKVKAPFQLATCGWVLGPQTNRALFDQELPKNMPFSCINRQVGHDPVEPSFAEVKGRDKWAIPWLEDDPAMISAQLWAGRMRKDAADAYAYGCTGLMGIHWRTRIMGPNVSALAQAGWSRGTMMPPGSKPEMQNPPRPVLRTQGPDGGGNEVFTHVTIQGTKEPELYRTQRTGLRSYCLPVSNGTHNVMLQFCELVHAEKGKRIFTVKIQGQPVLKDFDIFAEAGANNALKKTFKVLVTDGWLAIEFVPQVGEPCLSGLTDECQGYRAFNCGGPAIKGYAADPPPMRVTGRYLPSTDFYHDWARQLFGSEVAEKASDLFARIDNNLPRPSNWVNGPGNVIPDGRNWEAIAKDYAFVDEMESIRPMVKGAGNLERFDYWLDNFRHLRATARVDMLMAQQNKLLESLGKASNEADKRKIAREQLLPVRVQLVKALGEVYKHLLATVTNASELGTIANWEQHNLPGLLDKPGEAMVKALGEPLPAEAMPSREFAGAPRLVVPVVRTAVNSGETLKLKVMVLDREPHTPVLHWRHMGKGQFQSVPAKHLARAVYEVAIPAGGLTEDVEYYIEVESSAGKLRFPATAPQLNQTVIVIEPTTSIT